MLKRKHFLRDGLPYYAKAHVFVSFPHKKSSLPFLYRPPPIPRRPPQLISVVPHQRDSHISRRLLISHQDTLSSEEEKSSPSITISRRCKDGAIELFYCHPLLMSRRSRCSIFCQSGVCTLCFTTTRAHGCDKKYCSCSQKIYYRTHHRTKRAVNNRLLPGPGHGLPFSSLSCRVALIVGLHPRLTMF